MFDTEDILMPSAHSYASLSAIYRHFREFRTSREKDDTYCSKHMGMMHDVANIHTGRRAKIRASP